MRRHWEDLLVETIMRKRDVGVVAFSIAPRRHGRDGTSGRVYIEDGASEAVRRGEEELVFDHAACPP
jgi:hypothetical protein